MNAEKLVLYRPEKGSLAQRLLSVFYDLEQPGADAGRIAERYLECVKEMITVCEERGFSGNLWHCYLTYYLVYHENAYSRSCEIRGMAKGSIRRFALEDCRILIGLYGMDFAEPEEKMQVSIFPMLPDYQAEETGRKTFNRRIRDRICELALQLGSIKDPEEFLAALSEFYHEYGVGKFGLHKAFRIRESEGGAVIEPITNIAHVQLSDLVGYESAKQKLVENTEAFLAGRRANNCLLYGDAGTGKSSSIKGILNRYYGQGLRIIEVYKHQFRLLNDVIAQIKNRNYRFIIYMDDLSFEEFETEYKYLKAVIEGGLEKKPENILIYATSNRRHLIRENYADKEDVRQDMHTSDTVQEKLSLANRFGVMIYYGSPDKKEFQEIVRVLAKRQGVMMDEEELLLEANRWELSHGGFSGRCAQQFIDYILGCRTAGSTM